jgi:integrase
MITESPSAMQYWQSELANKEEGTKQRYQQYFNEFLSFVSKTPDELIVQRQQDLLNLDRKIQRRIESLLLAFLAKKKADGYAVATRQIYFASIRSFFEIHYFPLIMRRGDYPKGDSNGVKRATKDAILKVLDNKHQRNKLTIRAIMLFIKDSGLRVSDVRRLNYGDIAKLLENGETIIQINIITEKTNLLAKTFIGEEAIQALKEYLEARKQGSKDSRNVEPEIISKDSPLFKVWAKGEVRRYSRHSLSSIMREAFASVDEDRMSAHSLRKKLQTDLEKAGINSNWIDQILGHQLINTRDAYSLPTDEELKEAYLKAYPSMRVYQEIKQHIVDLVLDETTQLAIPLKEVNMKVEDNYAVAEARNITKVKQLLAKGYKFEMEYNGIMVLTRKMFKTYRSKPQNSPKT